VEPLLTLHWRCKGTGAPPSNPPSQPTPELTPPLPGTPPGPHGEQEGAKRSQIDNLPPRYVYSHSPFPSAQFVKLDAYVQDSQHDKDHNPDMLTDQGSSTG